MTGSVNVKMMADVRDQVLADLRRPHPFASERVGFLSSVGGNRDGANRLVFLVKYLPVPDRCYIEDPDVGARIDSTAIHSAMQHVLDNPGTGIFHVHLHDW